jgi:hypothetical protein
MFPEEHSTLVWQRTKRREARTNPTRKEAEEMTSGERVAVMKGKRIEGN